MNRSHWIALLVALSASAWMASGVLGDSSETEREQVATDQTDSESRVRLRVQTEIVKQQHLQQSLTVQGVASPLRDLTIKAETAGRVDAVLVPRGKRVAENEVLAQLELSERQARLKEAQALLTQRSLEYEASRKLKTQGMRSDSQLAEAVTLLESARRQLQSIQLDIEKATITAPFSGIINQRSIEVGDYVKAGDAIAQLIQLDPFAVRAQVSENRIASLKTGMPAQVTLINSQQLDASISYISARADTATRTFTVEFELRNPGSTALFGSTASVRIPLGERMAHRISPSILSLDKEDRIAIKTVEDGRVKSWPVTILESGKDGFWVSGLPPVAEVISVGADFTHTGDRVETVQKQ